MGKNFLVWGLMCGSMICALIEHVRNGMGKRSGSITWSRRNGTNSVTIDPRDYTDSPLGKVFRLPKKGFGQSILAACTSKGFFGTSQVCWVWYRLLLNWGSKLLFGGGMINATMCPRTMVLTNCLWVTSLVLHYRLQMGLTFVSSHMSLATIFIHWMRI